MLYYFKLNMCMLTKLLRFLRSFTNPMTRERKEALGRHLVDTIHKYKSSFKSANNKFDLLVLDPLELNDIHVDDFYQLKLTNVTLSGTENFTVTFIDVDLTRNRIESSICMPHVKLDGIQTLSLQTDSLPCYVQGSGPITATISDFNVFVDMRGNRVTRDEKTYIKFDDMKVKIVAGEKELIVGTMHDAHPNISAIGGNFMQHNAEMFVGDMLPALEIALQDALLKIINKITNCYTYDEIFLIASNN